MTILCIFFLVAFVAATCRGDHHRNRAANLQARVDELEAANVRLHAAIDEHLETTEEMLEHTTALERRNVWLEQRRYTVLRRWWRRSGYRALAWQVGRML